MHVQYACDQEICLGRCSACCVNGEFALGVPHHFMMRHSQFCVVFVSNPPDVSGKPFRLHNVLMKPGFVISGCAEAAPVASAGKEPVSTPEKEQDAMVCVRATRSSQTPPLTVADIHRVLEGPGVLECPDHSPTINWIMVCRTINVIIVRGRWDPCIDIRP